MAGSSVSIAEPGGEGHTHRHHRGNALLDAARKALEARGEQWTALRSAVFDILRGFDRPASAYDVTELLSKAQGRRVAANSVYRILDLFVSTNLAQRIESANAYVANPHPGCLHDCIFLVCDRCGQTVHVDDDSVAGQVRAVARAAGFAPERPVIEVRGLCPDCVQAGGR
jgi:Fur family zinc uptake transcriptional regulator